MKPIKWQRKWMISGRENEIIIRNIRDDLHKTVTGPCI